MADRRSRKQSGTPAGGQFAAGPRSETDVQLHAPADPATEVAVPNPDDPFDMPIYEGPAAGANTKLIPGSYAAYGLDDSETAYLLTVPNQGQIEWTVHEDGTKDAVVEGVAITTVMLDPDDDPDDDTKLRVVVFAAGAPKDSGTYAYDFDAAAWKATGPGVSSVEDSADQAVRALVMAHKRRAGA